MSRSVQIYQIVCHLSAFKPLAADFAKSVECTSSPIHPKTIPLPLETHSSPGARHATQTGLMSGCAALQHAPYTVR